MNKKIVSYSQLFLLSSVFEMLVTFFFFFWTDRDAVAMLRKTEKLNKLVYLSCNPTAKSVMENFVALCRPPSKTLQNNPFFPRRAVVVDMFPHTPHFELVVYFERLDDSTLLMNENNLTANLES